MRTKCNRKEWPQQSATTAKLSCSHQNIIVSLRINYGKPSHRRHRRGEHCEHNSRSLCQPYKIVDKREENHSHTKNSLDIHCALFRHSLSAVCVYMCVHWRCATSHCWLLPHCQQAKWPQFSIYSHYVRRTYNTISKIFNCFNKNYCW